MFKLEPRPAPSKVLTFASPLIALAITVIVGVILFVALGKDPLAGLQMFFVEPLKSGYALSELSVKATPLILIGLAFGLNHEVMSLPQLACAVAMAVGGFCFFWDFKGKGIKPLAALLVIGSALLYAVYYLVLRYAGTKAANPLDILWMIDCGFFVSSLVMMVIYPRAIGSIKAALASSRGKILPLELLNGLLIRFAAICAIMGLTMAPTAGHFAAFAGLLPLFTFAIGAGVSALDRKSVV